MKTIAINLEQPSNIIEEQINECISHCKTNNLIKENNISDGWHTFDDLYEFRKLYNAALFNDWAKEWRKEISSFAKPLYDVHKSIRHNDGELCFGGGWFIVVAVLPTGQISNHYKLEDWDLFKIPDCPKAKYEFDGHTPEDVMERLKSLCNE